MRQRIDEVPFLCKFSRKLALWDTTLFFIIAKVRCLTSLSTAHKVWGKILIQSIAVMIQPSDTKVASLISLQMSSYVCSSYVVVARGELYIIIFFAWPVVRACKIHPLWGFHLHTLAHWATPMVTIKWLAIKVFGADAACSSQTWSPYISEVCCIVHALLRVRQPSKVLWPQFLRVGMDLEGSLSLHRVMIWKTYGLRGWNEHEVLLPAPKI